MRRGAKPAKAKVEAKPSIARKARKSEGSRVHDLEKRLAEALKREAEALDQQTATAEILGVISSSPADAQPVFDAIAVNALRLCDAGGAVVVRYDGALLHVAAHHNVNPEAVDRLERQYPLAPEHNLPMGRAVLDGAVVHVPDLQAAVEFSGSVARQFGARSHVSIPLLHQGRAIGAIGISRRTLGPFSDRQIALLQTFAEQAVIAIENARQFREQEASNRDLTEALEQQTATSEILRAISASPTDLQGVLDTVAASAARLCNSVDAQIFRIDGTMLRIAASYGQIPKTTSAEARPISRGSVNGRAVVDRQTIHVHDLAAESDTEFPVGKAYQKLFGHRTVVATPLLREETPIGAITIRRMEVRPFTEKEITLLETFADQAVIAIENVRLFRELEARNRDLTEALEQQTATGEILRVISSSPTDVQPVFQTIAASAVRLSGALFGSVYRFDGELIHMVAHHNYPAAALEFSQRSFPTPPNRQVFTGRAILERAVVHVPDVSQDQERLLARDLAEVVGFRSALSVPMLREGSPIGAITVWRSAVGPFSDQHVTLLQTFADQAVIAVENVRLFKELQARTNELTRSVGELTALGDVSRALSSTLDLETVLQTIVTRANQLTGTAGCTIWEYDEPREEFRLRVSHYADEADAAVLEALGRVTTIRKGQGVTTQVMEQRQPVQIPDIAAEGAYESPIRGPLVEAGHRALLGVPLLSEDEVIGVLAVTRKAPGVFEPEIVRLLSTFATQSALAVQNARLFREIEDKSQQLETASRHKSEFLANMSHELRTPLNAVIGFSEVLLQRMFGELNDKQDEYLKDIYASGQHLLSLINDILDHSKIEAGRMELTPAPFHLPSALENAVTLVKERAGRHAIALNPDVDPQLGEVVGDERKIKQVLLNLLSNAVKFTPEGGRITLKAGPRDGAVEIAVTDTGIGIALEDQAAIFEEFRQVGSDERRREGTGLGLTLAKKFVELHGGRIWVESEVGRGATFTFTLPLR